VTTASEQTRPRLRPLSTGEILDVSIKICVAQWRTLLKAVLIVVVPVQIVSTILTADYTVSSFDFGASSSQTPQQTLDELNQYIGGLAISGLLQLCAVGLATAACFRAIGQSYLGESADWRESLRFATRHIPSLLLLTLLYVLGVGLGTVLFIAPGVWLYVAWAFALPVLLVEGLRGRNALGRSFALVKGRWWKTFGTLVVGFILAAIISSLMQAVFLLGAVVGDDNDTVVLVLSALAGIVGLAISTPFQAALLTVLYFDLRVRKEGFDLELLAREIGAGAPTPAPESESASVSAPASALWPAPDHAPARGPAPREQIERNDRPVAPPPPGWHAPPAPPEDDDEPPRLPGVPSG
jgi:hypothetical protein